MAKKPKNLDFLRFSTFYSITEGEDCKYFREVRDEHSIQ